MDNLISIQEDTLVNNTGSGKISLDHLWTYRFVITAWTRSISDCCSTDLKTSDFENVNIILHLFILNTIILNIIARNAAIIITYLALARWLSAACGVL